MAFTYDVATSRGRVRLLASDRDSANPIFQDDEIDTFLALNPGLGTVYHAAADALETIAADEALMLKVIESNGLRTDGARLAQALMTRAAVLRTKGEAMDDTGDPGFEIAEFADTFPQTIEALIKGAIRRG